MSENAKQNGREVEVTPSTSLQCISMKVIIEKGEVKFCYIFIKILKYTLKYLISYNFIFKNVIKNHIFGLFVCLTR